VPELLLDAYSHGIFPWSGDPVCWFSPNPRAVFRFGNIKIPRKLARIARRDELEISFDQDFPGVIRGCADARPVGETWICAELIRGYCKLNEMGFAHSVEVHRRGVLVGGLYGVHLNGLFAGESMFYRHSNASKIAFAALVDHLQNLGIRLFDAQVLNPHTESLGAIEISRDQYLDELHVALDVETAECGQAWSRPSL